LTYIPLIAFLLAVAWIVWRGYQAKRAYLKQPRENFVSAEYLIDLLQAKRAASHK
jgi:hypothetical protein